MVILSKVRRLDRAMDDGLLKTGIVLIHVLVQIGERGLDRSKILSRAGVQREGPHLVHVVEA